MYLMLGDIVLEPIDITDFSETQSATFAEHAVLKGKPRLQAMGEGLTELRFACRLHYKVGHVEQRYQALLSAKRKQNALALLWGRGKFKGNFVITDISSTTLFTDKYGNVLSRELDINLKEFAGEIKNKKAGAALNAGKGALLGSFLPKEVKSALNSAKEMVKKGVAIFNEGKRVFNEVQNTISIVKQFADDPVSALASLPSAISGVDKALGGFGQLVGMSEALNSVSSVLPVVGQFTQEVSSMYSEFNSIQQEFTHAIEGADFVDWFSSVESSINTISDSFDRLAEPVAKMTAWVVLREDEEVLDDSIRT